MSTKFYMQYNNCASTLKPWNLANFFFDFIFGFESVRVIPTWIKYYLYVIRCATEFLTGKHKYKYGYYCQWHLHHYLKSLMGQEDNRRWLQIHIWQIILYFEAMYLDIISCILSDRFDIAVKICTAFPK